MKRTLLALAVALVAMGPSLASAAPIYALGDKCPTTADYNDPNLPYTAQYSVTGALACVFDTVTTGNLGNIGEGDQADWNAEAAYYLGALGGWTGLGQTPTGFTGTAPGDDVISGSFNIGGTLDDTYNQFAIGIKDGHNPKWAIFLLDVGVFSGNWSILGGGALSHYALYGRTTATGRCTTVPCEPEGDDPTPVPDGGATLAMLGFAIGGLGLVRRKL